jgi:hypothetical protein
MHARRTAYYRLNVANELRDGGRFMLNLKRQTSPGLGPNVAYNLFPLLIRDPSSSTFLALGFVFVALVEVAFREGPRKFVGLSLEESCIGVSWLSRWAFYFFPFLRWHKAIMRF